MLCVAVFWVSSALTSEMMSFAINMQTVNEKLCISVPVHLISSYFRDWNWNFLELVFDIS